MRFLQGTNFDNYPKYSFSGNNIEITLPESMYRKYGTYKNDDCVNNLIISSIVTEALYQALYLIGKEQYIDKEWSKSLRNICGEANGSQDIDFSNVLAYPELINKILKNHSKRIFESIETLKNVR